LRIGVVAKPDDDSLELVKDILEYGSSIGIDMVIDARLANSVRWKKVFELGKDRVDYLIVIGGDGTVLNTLLALGDDAIPLITIKSGKRAFLYDCLPSEFSEVLRRLLSGDYMIREYMRAEAVVNDTIKLPYALNEYVLATSGFFRSKVAHLKVFKKCSDGAIDEIYDVMADGLLIATSVGSTAYNASVGGPLVDPDLEALILTPLAPLDLFVRSMVFPSSAEIIVEVVKDSLEVDVIVDGMYVAKLGPNDRIKVRRAPTPAKFVRFHSLTYGKLVRRLFYER